MKIAFCTSPLAGGHNIRGIGNYTRNLLSILKKYPGVEIEEFVDIKAVKKADLVHYPYFDLFSRSLPLRKKFQTVVTIHDVIPLVFPKFYPPGKKGSLNLAIQKISLRSVSAVITDSQVSKKDIIKYLHVKDKKIFSIPLAASNYFKKISNKNILEATAKKFNLPKKFALFTGNVNWNKNLINLTEASIKSNIDLVLIGKGFEDKNNLNHPEMKSFKEFLNKFSSNPKIHILGFVEDDDLVAILNLADLLLFPSFAEGFGLPVLEAQACGIPVVTSNVSSMPEVAGRGALLVNPYSVEEISKAIDRILKKTDLREELIKEGFKNVEKFSWEKVASDTVEVYKQILKK